MASSMKCIYYKEPSSQLNNYNTMQAHNQEHLRSLYNDTRAFTKLSNTILDNVVYQRIYGGIPTQTGVPADIMGAAGKRYSAVVDGSAVPVKEIKRQSLQLEPDINRDREPDKVGITEKVDDQKQDKCKTEEQEQKISDTECTSNDDSLTSDSSCYTSDMSSDTSPEKSPTVRRKSDVGSILAHTVVLQKHFSLGQETDLSNGIISEKKKRLRSNSELGLGAGRRKNSSQIDITSTPLYKEIYANNLRQYGFILAKQLGISNQSPKELRATYLQNRQRAEQRREEAFKNLKNNSNNTTNNNNKDNNDNSNDATGNGTEERLERLNHGRSNSFADFGRRPQQCPRRLSKIDPTPPTTSENNNKPNEDKPCTKQTNLDEIVGSEASHECSSTATPTTTSTTTTTTTSRPQIKIRSYTTCSDSNRQTATRMRRSNTIEYLDRWCKDRPLAHSRSVSDLSANKCSNSLTNISESFDQTQIQSRELRRQSCFDSSSGSPSPQNSPCGSDSSESTDRTTETSSSDCGSAADSSPVVMRRLRKVHDPHKRLSVPLLQHTNPTPSLDQTSRRSSTPDVSDKTGESENDATPSKSVMSSLSVPNLYHQSSFGKDKLMDDYCRQDVPRRRLSVVSLRRHNEAQERLEQRMLKLKSFDGVLTEADTFIKDMQLRKTASTRSIQEDAIPE